MFFTVSTVGFFFLQISYMFNKKITLYTFRYITQFMFFLCLLGPHRHNSFKYLLVNTMYCIKTSYNWSPYQSCDEPVYFLNRARIYYNFISVLYVYNNNNNNNLLLFFQLGTLVKKRRLEWWCAAQHECHHQCWAVKCGENVLLIYH
jgi:hypothetical protein